MLPVRPASQRCVEQPAVHWIVANLTAVICGRDNAPSPDVCARSDRVGETEDGLPIFGQDARSTITVYDGDGSCETGDCRDVDFVETCPDRLGYGMDNTVDYGCLNSACLERCDLKYRCTLAFEGS